MTADCSGDGAARRLWSEEHCIKACPEDAIHMEWVPAQGDGSVGCWRSAEEMDFETAEIEIPEPALK
jgi:hypothetical protein